VQHFWSTLIAEGLEGPSSYEQPTRPKSVELVGMFRRANAELINALATAEPSDACWTWHGPDQSIGWVRRRQAHEALIHRIDAELSVRTPSPIDVQLAADGIDEILSVMLDVGDLADWATYVPSKDRIALECTDIEWSDGESSTGISSDGAESPKWNVELGVVSGTDELGTLHNLLALSLLPSRDSRADLDVCTSTIRAPAAEMDLWLWGRGDLSPQACDGDSGVVKKLRLTAADATQ